ncbi:MAG: aldo/keto reductase [Bryobacteraceae bacterium]|jgi:aryl-alcohol dehydrogenase-like predicted oxidoreductase
MSISRREFLGTAAVAGLAASPLPADTGNTTMPTRVLGKTGVHVSILAMGGGSRFLSYKAEDQALAAIHRAIDLGITYFDSADDYGGHLSEQRIGTAIKGRRDGVFLVSKVTPRSGDEAKRAMELTLKSLDVDHLDLLHIHQLGDEDDLAQVEAKGNVLEQLLKFRDQKMTRFIGITSHANPATLKMALERHDFDCAQMALNAGQVAMRNGTGNMVPNRAMKLSFETTALPVAVRKQMGVLGMKVFAQEAMVGQAPPQKLLYYTLSLPITAAVVGMPKLEYLEENVRLAKTFQPLPNAEMQDISGRLSARNKVALDRFFDSHLDA